MIESHSVSRQQETFFWELRNALSYLTEHMDMAYTIIVVFFSY